MQLHAETWGHVALTVPATAAMEKAEEENETLMLRCRHDGKFARARASCFGFLLNGLLPSTTELICNPSTLRDLADIFQARMQ